MTRARAGVGSVRLAALGSAHMTSDSDDLERQFRQNLKRLEAELARPNGIAAEKQKDEQLRQQL